MKFFRILCLGAAIALPQFALAEVPFDVQTLALLDASMDFCSKANPASAEKFKDYATRLQKDVPKTDLDAVRNSDEYKETRKSISDQFNKLSKDEANKTCSDFLKTNK